MLKTNTSYKLVNFNVPNYLLRSFDTLVRFKNISRTSMLITLMESYLRKEKDKIEEDNQINDFIVNVENNNSLRFKKELKKIKSIFEKSIKGKVVDPKPQCVDRNDDYDYNPFKGRTL
jgi:metal-responsive CopG/Arc/MetJ family transcriptional regulator